MPGRAGPTPRRVRVRMYRVGFGDCFLLTFQYPRALDDGRRERHVLVDFGTTRLAPSGPRMGAVAELVREHCGGTLDVVVASHRHRDHLSGFGAAEAEDVLDTFAPRLVVQPWTEDPDAAADATAPDRSRRFLAALGEAERFAAEVVEAAKGARGARGALAGFAAAQLTNRRAIERLQAWAGAGTASYLSYGRPSGIEDVVPGIEVRVLGPPTVDEHPEVATQDADDPEYWLRRRALAATTLRRRAGPRDDVAPGPTRWLVEQLASREVGSLRRIVRALDHALNNTSLILLIDAGRTRMLFGGDAQIENWSYALRHAPDSDSVRRALRAVDLYKVGHHGSRNGTPRSLVDLWERSGTTSRVALLSTLPDVHGETEATAVPRTTLVEALARVATVHRTDELDDDFLTVEAATSEGVFKLVRD